METKGLFGRVPSPGFSTGATGAQPNTPAPQFLESGALEEWSNL